MFTLMHRTHYLLYKYLHAKSVRLLVCPALMDSLLSIS